MKEEMFIGRKRMQLDSTLKYKLTIVDFSKKTQAGILTCEFFWKTKSGIKYLLNKKNIILILKSVLSNLP